MSNENVLTPYEKVLAARKSDRPDIMKYIEVLFDDFVQSLLPCEHVLFAEIFSDREVNPGIEARRRGRQRRPAAERYRPVRRVFKRAGIPRLDLDDDQIG